MRFGSVDSFISIDAKDLRIGRQVANHEFLKALLTYGTFEHYHLFVPDVAHISALRQRLSLLLPSLPLKRLQIAPFLTLKETLQENEFTVFHQGDFTRYIPYLAPIRNRYSCSQFPITGTTHSLNTYLMATRYLQLATAQLRPYDAVVCTSDAGRRAVEKGYHLMRESLFDQTGIQLSLPVRLAHIPLGIEDERFSVPDKQDARQRLGVRPGVTLLLCLGRISSRSKMDLLPVVQRLAFEWAGARLPDVELIIAGGAEASELERLHRVVSELGIQGRVRLLPDFEPETKSVLLGAADIFLAPADNLQETFGLSILEAMAAGLAPIVSDFDGYRELVEHGRTGFCLPTTWGALVDAAVDLEAFFAGFDSFYAAQTFAVDLEAMVETIRLLSAQVEQRKTMGEAARNRARRYRWSNIIRSYETLWLDLSREAQTCIRLVSSRRSPLETDPLTIFSHYPTLSIEDSMRFTISSLGRSYLGRGELPLTHPDMQMALHAPLLWGLLHQLEQTACDVLTLRLEGTSLEIASAVTDYHILWLLKYGMIQHMGHLAWSPLENPAGEGAPRANG